MEDSSPEVVALDSPPWEPPREREAESDVEGEAEWTPGADEENEEGDADEDEDEDEDDRSSGEEEDETGGSDAGDASDDFVVVDDGDGEAAARPKKRARRGPRDASSRSKRARDRRRKKKLAELIGDDELDEATKRARDAERARASRLNLSLSEDQLADEGEAVRICLNIDTDGSIPTGEEGTAEAPVFAHHEIAGRLKKHQIIGARFMWSHIAAEPGGFGCVLADFMGLGKTLQVITVVQAFLTSKRLDEDGYLVPRHKHVLILAPTICVRNWEAEVVKWIGKKDARKIGLQTLESSREKKMTDRVHVVKQWHRRGGILIMGYELYRLLVLQSSGDEKIAAGNAKHSHLIKQVYPLLANPGPDLIVLDEGHRVRDHKSKLVKALSHVKTARRIILTGYPLQNHLEEYWTMVNFARPDYLGSLDEFKNRFVDPIENAQCVDSCEADLRLARQRAYVLTRELKPLVLRRDQQYLFKQLPPKKEWVLLCKLTDAQAKLYRQFLEQGVPKRIAEVPGEGIKQVVDVLGGFHVALSISNHPDVLMETYRRLEEEYRNGKPKKTPGRKRKRLAWSLLDDEDEDEFEFFNEQPVAFPAAVPAAGRPKASDGTDESDLEILDALFDKSTGAKPAPKKAPETPMHRLSFAKSFLEKYEAKRLEASGKMMILMQILTACQKINDRVIIFSQSIPTLNTIGELINKYNKNQRSHANRLSYLRIDGSTPQQERFRQIGVFNDPDEDVDMIMISTKAGGEGINLCAGNRIIIFDVCWNPCNDSQSMCRSYRFGQTKPVFVYRFVTAGTMEKKVYDLQIRKEGVAKRIVDEKTTERKFKSAELQNYFNVDEFEASLKHSQGQEESHTPRPPPQEDAVLTSILSDFGTENEDAKGSDSLNERCIIDWFEQETMFEEDLDQQCSPAEQKEIMESYIYHKALRRLRKHGEHLLSREGLLVVQCQSCRITNEIYPSSTTKVPVPTKIECSYCKQPTSTEGAGPAPPPSAVAAAYASQYPFLNMSSYAAATAAAAAAMAAQAAVPPTSTVVDTGRAAASGYPAPEPGRHLPSQFSKFMQQQQAAAMEKEKERAKIAAEAQRLALVREQERLRKLREYEEKKRQERQTMKLKDRHLLVLRRSMEGCQKLKRSAEECGATIAIEVNSQLTDIVSAMSKEDTLRWLKLTKLPRDVDLHDAAWLRNEIAKAQGQPSQLQDGEQKPAAPASSGSAGSPDRATASPAESESVATDRSHDESDHLRAADSSSSMIELLDSDDEMDGQQPTARQRRLVEDEEDSDSDSDFVEILD
jgi:SNF2 family DNA or RNA helicase/flagellar motility protein MotE (MotC chaperone)